MRVESPGTWSQLSFASSDCLTPLLLDERFSGQVQQAGAVDAWAFSGRAAAFV